MEADLARGGQEGLQVLDMGTNLFHIIFVDDVQMNRIWNLPLGYVDADILSAVGAHIGEVMKVDKRSIEQERDRYVQMKVKLDVHKPLKRGGLVPMRVNQVQVVHRYKKICDVCLYCGMLGHEHHACDAKFNDEVRKTTRANKYDAWM
ncbi:hypothetical protein LIER_31193 [Lithospermum erythrorhizon]|uniref:CCHC-type domain-containing protein n=1 Tax=Lithospermum erythrorhizon TaxID=34254 RepID=A0AAV3RR70_LITER